MSTVKVSVLRNFRHGEHRGIKGKDLDLPEALAEQLAKGSKPAVKLKKG